MAKAIGGLVILMNSYDVISNLYTCGKHSIQVGLLNSLSNLVSWVYHRLKIKKLGPIIVKFKKQTDMEKDHITFHPDANSLHDILTDNT